VSLRSAGQGTHPCNADAHTGRRTNVHVVFCLKKTEKVEVISCRVWLEPGCGAI
jgi:hypothetical protein